MIDKDNLWGPDDIMVTAAHRYCMGRMTYIVADCVDWLIYIWPHLKSSTQFLVIQETKVSIDRGFYGMEIDKAQWQRLLKRVEKEELPKVE